MNCLLGGLSNQVEHSLLSKTCIDNIRKLKGRKKHSNYMCSLVVSFQCSTYGVLLVSINYDFRILLMSEKNHQFMHVHVYHINFVIMTEFVITILLYTGELLGCQRNSQCQQNKDQSSSFNSLY